MTRNSEGYLPEFSERALVAYERLSAADKTRVDSVLQDIQSIGLKSRWVTRMHGPHKIYLARAGTRLRILFQHGDDVLTILDIVARDQLDRLTRLYRWNED